MIVMRLLDEWSTSLGVARVADQNENDRVNGSTFDDFLQHQKDVWTPSELYEKCCTKFLVGGIVRRNKNGRFVCCDADCRKRHPLILLYFDAGKNCTVATLSCRLDPFTKYFDQCVKEGNAVWRSALYCELNGFVRENLHRLRHHQRFFGGHLVKTAIGALNDSDAAQRSLLEDIQLRQHLRRHQPWVQFDNAANTSRVECNRKARGYENTGTLEIVLEICRLWGLGDNLDVLSIDCMIRTSQAFRKVALPMAEKRVKECKFVVTPLVDGHVKSGYSVFRRADPTRERIVEREDGRLVEYAVGPSTLYLQKVYEVEDMSNEATRKKCISGKFVPASSSNVNFNSERSTSATDESNGFCWACEELSYTNLELEFMDINLPEYVGQKVVVHWERGKMDIPNVPKKIDPDSQCPLSSLMTPKMPVFRFKLDWTSQKEGITKVSVPHFDVKLDIQKASAMQVDEVTFLYQGRAEIIECRVEFAFLVAAYARSLKPLLRARHKKIETMRPLLKHEHAFFEEVQSAASICSSSPLV